MSDPREPTGSEESASESRDPTGEPTAGAPTAPETEPTDNAASPPVAPQTELRTFLIADIRGYTTYTREHGDEAGAALASRFAELVSEVVSARDGYLLELRGDEALVVFVSARKALRAAVDLQARFIEDKLPRGVGIGLDAGEAIPVGKGFRGTALNLAARLCAKAGPGETLASSAVIHLAAKIEGIAYVDAQELKLKGYADAVRAVVVLPSERARGHRLASADGTRPRDPRRYAIVGVAMVVVAAVAGVGGGLLRGGPPGVPGATPDPLAGAELPLLAFYDAETGSLKSTTPFQYPRNIAMFAGGSFWMLELSRAFHRIDPITHTVVQSINVPLVAPSGYNFDDKYFWVTDLTGPEVVRIDQRTGTPTTFPFGKDESDTAPAVDVGVSDGYVWLTRPDAREGTGEIVRLDAETGEVKKRIGVQGFGINAGGGSVWYGIAGRIGRIDPETNEVSFEIELSADAFIGNIYVGGGDAWTAATSTGHVWRVDKTGHQTPYTLQPGVAEMAATDGTMWVTNANTGLLTGIDLVTGLQDLHIDTGHATMAVAAGDGQIMIAVGPTVDEVIADLDGTVLTITSDWIPWFDPAPDPALNGFWEVHQALYVTCVGLLNYPDEPAPKGWTLEPEVAAELPTVSADGQTYTFTIRPGYMFSPPSNEVVTAETFKTTIERTLWPGFEDWAPGPTLFSDIVGAKAYRAGKADEVTGIVASGDQLTITLEEPSADFLYRLAMPYACPVPIGTPALRSGLDPDPPVAGAGPYYVERVARKWLVVLKKNPNYHGPRAQPFDAIAIEMKVAPASAIAQVQNGHRDAAMLGCCNPITGPGSTIATEWGPGSANAAAGDQRWFGAPRLGVDYIALNQQRVPFSDPDVRRAMSLALDRVELAGIFGLAPTTDLLVPSVPGSTVPDEPDLSPDLKAATALMRGRKLNVTMMGWPTECRECRAFELAVKGQLKKIGITVNVRHPDDDDERWGAWDLGSDIDLIAWASWTDFPDPASLIAAVQEDAWLSKANLRELEHLQSLRGQARLDGAVAFAQRMVEKEFLIVPFGNLEFPFFISERISCGFVQPAIGAVDLLSCIEDGAATATSSASP